MDDYDPIDNSIKCYDIAIKALREKGVREGRFEPMSVEELEIAPKKKRARKASGEYADFLAAKSHTAMPVGIEPPDSCFPSAMKPFQVDMTRWALRRGRAAIFAGTGLGKTLMQLTWADAVAKETAGRVLILTPLAVAQQTVAEAAKFGIDGVAYALDAEHQVSRIVVTNYDRFNKFSPDDYSAIVLDESSIIKAHDSKTRKTLIAACKDIPYRLCCTATPAPNDWVELGNHSEFLGVMTDKEMLSMYFVHDGSVRAKDDVGGDGWRLKRHAEDAFWRWVASWAAVIRHPKDLGYDEPGYDLPELIRHQVTVDVSTPLDENTLFGVETKAEAKTLKERLTARRNSIAERVAAGAAIVNAEPDKPWLIWCQLNDEADALAAAIPGAVEVRGPDDRELKADRMMGFCHGNPRILLSKPSIAGFGMNFQHCSDMIFVGLNDSFEQLYQAIRRCWRFGQAKPVNVYMVASSQEGAVVKNLERKELAYDVMGEAMAAHMREFVREEVRGSQRKAEIVGKVKMEIPVWLNA